MSLELWILTLERLLMMISGASPVILALLCGQLTVLLAMCFPSTRTFVLDVLRLLVAGIQAWRGGGGDTST